VSIEIESGTACKVGSFRDRSVHYYAGRIVRSAIGSSATADPSVESRASLRRRRNRYILPTVIPTILWTDTTARSRTRCQEVLRSEVGRVCDVAAWRNSMR